MDAQDGIRPDAAIRAGTVQHTYRHLARYWPEACAVVTHLLPRVARDITLLPRTAWIPLDKDVPFAEAIYEALGPKEAKAFWTDFIVAYMAGSPLVSGVVQSALRAMNQSPGALFARLPKALPSIYRDIVDARLDTLDELSAKLVFENVDRRYISRPVYRLIAECQGRAILRSTGHRGSVKVIADLDARRLELISHW